MTETIVLVVYFVGLAASWILMLWWLAKNDFVESIGEAALGLVFTGFIAIYWPLGLALIATIMPLAALYCHIARLISGRP